MQQKDVILVNERDEALGTMEKMDAHRQGLLHRAFSVFIFDSKGRMLLQKRAASKYHGGGLWSNACCSHPYPEERIETAAERRLLEELGFTIPLNKIFEFTYNAKVENDLIEHEYDHVFVGEYEGVIKPTAEEVEDYRYVEMNEIKQALTEEGNKFTTWFRLAFPTIETWWQQHYQQK